MDIELSKKLKIHLRLARGWLLKKMKKEFGVTIDDIIYDIEHSGNPSVIQIWKTVKKNAEECVMKHQQRETKLWAAIFLWILSKDTAYRDLYFAIAKELLEAKDAIYPEIKKLAKDPEHWYANAHKKSMDRRKKGQQEGTLLDRGRPYDETMAVPFIQNKRLKGGEKVEPVNIIIGNE